MNRKKKFTKDCFNEYYFDRKSKVCDDNITYYINRINA